jgi:hypothetical protein
LPIAVEHLSYFSQVIGICIIEKPFTGLFRPNAKKFVVTGKIYQTGRLPDIGQENSNKQRRNFIRPKKAETDLRSTDTLLSKGLR